MPRLGFLGTYDDKWRQTRSPVPPEDFRFDFHNSAHPDLQVKGYLKGDEEVELVNLSPEGNLRFQLPGVRLSCTVIKTFARLAGASATSENSSVMEVPLQLDTLCLIPDEKRLFQVWRGLCPIADLGALEIKEVRLK